MFPITMYFANNDGTLTFPPDPYLSMRPMLPFPDGDFSFSLLPIQSMPVPSDAQFVQSVSCNGNERGNVTQTVTIRIIMSGKEVGSIIGKKGDNVKRFREQSGARINISDGSCPERIVSVSGNVDKVSTAFLLICQKFEDDYVGSDKERSDHQICPPVTLRLLVPATQCGSIIGKGGCKIKEIRDLCGASIQVASELLPSSSERSVTVSGTATSVAKCIKQISLILLETPVRFGTVPYRPKPIYNCQPQTMQHIHNISPVAAFSPNSPELLKPTSNMSSSCNMQPPIALFPMPTSIPSQMIPSNVVPAFLTDSLPFGNFPGQLPIWLKQQQQQQQQQQSLSYPSTPDLQSPIIMSPSCASQPAREMVIPNDLIGCVIGRAGSTINEIRSMSGAQIKISDMDEMSAKRHIIISGSVEAVNTAQLLINSNIQSYRNSLNSQNPKPSANFTDPSIISSTTSSEYHRQSVAYSCVQKSNPKLTSVHFNPDGSRRTDHSHFNPY